MSLDCKIQVTFTGAPVNNAEATVRPDPILTSELEDRIAKLLTGKFDVDADGRCIIDPDPWDLSITTRDSVCVSVNLALVSVSYCWELK